MKLIIDIEPRYYTNMHSEIKELYYGAINRITEAVSNGIPYEERPQGKWAKTGQSFVNPNKFRNFCCSNCLWELDEHIRIEPNFCPNCGADMRGEENG